MTTPREELQRVVTGELAVVNLLKLAKDSGYDRLRLKDMAREMGLVVCLDRRLDAYCASLPVEGKGRERDEMRSI